MWYVYIIRSVEFSEQEYTGATADLKQRLADHKAGKSITLQEIAPYGSKFLRAEQ